MSFLDLLKIEFMKVKRSKIVPLIFIAPLLVVVSCLLYTSELFLSEPLLLLPLFEVPVLLFDEFVF